MNAVSSAGVPARSAPATARVRRPVIAAVVIAAVGAATILGAYYFQYVKGLPPCPLCLEQRIAYYIAIPLAIVIEIAAAWRAPRRLVALGLGIIALIMLFNAGLALYHAGIEWRWWPGPQECSGLSAISPPAAISSRSCPTSRWCAATKPHGASSAYRSRATTC